MRLRRSSSASPLRQEDEQVGTIDEVVSVEVAEAVASTGAVPPVGEQDQQVCTIDKAITIDVGAGGYVSGDAGDDVILAEGIEIYGGAGSDLFVGDLTGDRSMSGVVLDFLPGEDAILFDVPGPDLEGAELVIGEPAFSEVYGRSLTEIALTAGGQTYSIFVQTAEEIQPDDIIVRGA